jgi:hypothetical protein
MGARAVFGRAVLCIATSLLPTSSPVLATSRCRRLWRDLQSSRRRGSTRAAPDSRRTAFYGSAVTQPWAVQRAACTRGSELITLAIAKRVAGSHGPLRDVDRTESAVGGPAPYVSDASREDGAERGRVRCSTVVPDEPFARRIPRTQKRSACCALADPEGMA